MRRVISTLALAVLVGSGAPSTSLVDAYARAGGNDKATAVQIGRVVFQHQWNAQILKIYADRAGSHSVAGMLLSGVKFHHPLTRTEFIAEVASIIDLAFSAAPVEEVDLWCNVPLSVGKGLVVSGDLAHPTQRTVFTVTVRRGESKASVSARIAAGQNVYWDALWAKQALARSPANLRELHVP